MTRLRVAITALLAVALLAGATSAPAVAGGGAKPACQSGSTCGG